MKALLAGVLVLLSAPAFAQPAQPSPPKERSALYDALAAELQAIKDSCSSGGFKVIATCGAKLATGQPFHLAFGSLAPQSGFGLGVAGVAHKNFPGSPWRFHGSGDVVAARGGSWRAGAYFNFDRVNTDQIGVTFDDPQAPDPSEPYQGTTIYSTYVQAISLNDLLFFRLGPDSSEAGESRWGMKQTIVGAKVYKPLRSGSANLSLIGSVNGRFVDVRSATTKDGFTIRQLYNDATAPGLGTPSARFVQFSEGIRLEPSWFGSRVYPSYAVSTDQFLSTGSANGSFNRLNLDLTHEFPFYKKSRSWRTSSELVSPNECSPSEDGACDSVSRDRDGGITIRFLTTMAWAREGNEVPFYFQPTLGGGDINGSQLLSGFSDYRFRAPNLIALQERFDHSLPGIEPVGFIFIAEQGKVASDRGDLSLSDLKQSVAVGLTVRAGGFPQILLLFGWSREGHHVGLTVNSSLLGGSTRPSLF